MTNGAAEAQRLLAELATARARDLPRDVPEVLGAPSGLAALRLATAFARAYKRVAFDRAFSLAEPRFTVRDDRGDLAFEVAPRPPVGRGDLAAALARVAPPGDRTPVALGVDYGATKVAEVQVLHWLYGAPTWFPPREPMPRADSPALAAARARGWTSYLETVNLLPMGRLLVVPEDQGLFATDAARHVAGVAARYPSGVVRFHANPFVDPLWSDSARGEILGAERMGCI
ncbi:MAG TPA: hypothetical protein VM889_05320 [Candidatus Thermoplasmatota archaeon]|nr:hypothetical protein [Candidatus Thermoplasmatota archaeon]